MLRVRLYTYRTLRQLFESSGFRAVLYEYFDEAGRFHQDDWNENAGMIWRSKRFDRRNQAGTLTFTSILLDAVKG
jgi:predicted SAM-dependent methyltransferase